MAFMVPFHLLENKKPFRPIKKDERASLPRYHLTWIINIPLKPANAWQRPAKPGALGIGSVLHIGNIFQPTDTSLFAQWQGLLAPFAASIYSNHYAICSSEGQWKLPANSFLLPGLQLESQGQQAVGEVHVFYHHLVGQV